MKVSKESIARSIVLLIIALTFVILGMVCLFIDGEKSVVVREKPNISKSEENIKVNFILENTSDENVQITYIKIEISTNKGDEPLYDREGISLAAGESKALEYVDAPCNSPNSVVGILVEANGKQYYAYDALGFGWIVIFCIVPAIVVCLLATANFVGVARQKKRYQSIEQEIKEKFLGKAIFAVGCYGSFGKQGKTSAKKTSAVVGESSAEIFGFGTNKIYCDNAPKEFVISDEGLFVGAPSEWDFNLDRMNFMEKRLFNQAEIQVKKKQVALSNPSSQDFFVFDLLDNKGVTAEQLAEKLNSLLASAEKSTDDVSTSNNEC